MALGAGRQRIEDRIDHGAGILVIRKPGDEVRAGETVLELLYNADRGLPSALALATDAVRLASSPPALGPLVLGRVA